MNTAETKSALKRLSLCAPCPIQQEKRRFRRCTNRRSARPFCLHHSAPEESGNLRPRIALPILGSVFLSQRFVLCGGGKQSPPEPDFFLGTPLILVSRGMPFCWENKKHTKLKRVKPTT